MIHIIGGAGFVGTRLSEVLSSQGKAFKILDKALTGESYCDVTDLKSLTSLSPADVVINLAAEHRDDVMPRSLYDAVNVEGAKNVCQYCRTAGINTIIFTSSVAVYGFAPEGTDEGGKLQPFNDYGRTKMEAEQVYQEWLAEAPHQRGLVIIRPTVIFGEGNRGNVYNLIRQIAGKRFIMIGPGKNRKSMAYIQNIAEFISYMTDAKLGLKVYNYVDKPDYNMNKLVTLSRRRLFSKENVGLRLPAAVGKAIGQLFDLFSALSRRTYPISSIRIKKFLETTSFDTSLAETGFIPRVSLEEGLDRFITNEFLIHSEKND